MSRFSRGSLIASVVLASAAGLAAHGQETEEDLAAQIEQLREGQEQIRGQLEEIKTMLQERPAPAAQPGPNVAGKVLDLGDNPVQGAQAARLTLVEFTDYQ